VSRHSDVKVAGLSICPMTKPTAIPQVSLEKVIPDDYVCKKGTERALLVPMRYDSQE
jgi:hypothetical protein